MAAHNQLAPHPLAPECDRIDMIRNALALLTGAIFLVLGIVFSALLSLLVLIVVFLDYAEHPRELGRARTHPRQVQV